jgi:hypothetical protein
MGAEYNPKKDRLEQSMRDINQSIEAVKGSTHLPSIEEETRKLAERQEWLYKMLSTVAVIGVLFTVYRVQ